MSTELPELDEPQTSYKAAVDAWIWAIRNEEALASANHFTSEIDQWERAHLEDNEMRSTGKGAKAKYEDGLRAKFVGF